MTDPNCDTCQGCGFIGDDDDHTPWKYLEELPPGSDIAVKMGLIKKLPCPECNVDAKVEPNLAAIGAKIAAVYKRLEVVTEEAKEVLTLEELSQFEQYVNHQEAIGFIFDPTAYRVALYGGQFDDAKVRIAVVRRLLTLGEKQ